MQTRGWWRPGWWWAVLVLVLVSACGTSPVAPTSAPVTPPVTAASVTPGVVATVASSPPPPVTPAPPIGTSSLPTLVTTAGESPLTPAAAVARAVALARAGSGPAGGGRLSGEPTAVRGRIVAGEEAERLQFGRVLPAAERRPGLTDRPLWVIYVEGPMVSVPAGSSAPACITGQPLPTFRLVRLHFDAVTGQLGGFRSWPVGREPDLQGEPLLDRALAATPTPLPPPTPRPSPPLPATPFPLAGGLQGRLGDRLTLPPAIAMPRPGAWLTLTQSGVPPLITQLEAMQAVERFGAPWGLGGTVAGRPVTVAAWYGCLNGFLPGDGTFPRRLSDGDFFTLDGWRAVWIIDYGNVVGAVSGAPAKPMPISNHIAYLIDAQTRTVVLTWWYHQS